MFTLDQIKETHAKVKSGADFPQYVQDLKQLGIQQYSQFVADGFTIYEGLKHKVESPAKYGPFTVANTANTPSLQHHLNIHQAGETDYITFCSHAAEDGVNKWTMDLAVMTCTYYDKQGNNMVVERIPGE